MFDWWESLPFLQQLFYYCAVPATLILIIQTFLSIIGIGNTDADIDTDVDADFDIDTDVDADMSSDIDFDGDADSVPGDAVESASSLKFFSIRGIVAFFSLFGWVGVVLTSKGVNEILTVFVAFLSGLAGMFTIAFLFYSITKLQCSGNKSIKNSIGKIAQVYIPIPANMNGKGKVQVDFQGSLTEVYAMTEENEKLSTGSLVLIVDAVSSDTVLVEKQI